jgi:hypothetical protein
VVAIGYITIWREIFWISLPLTVTLTESTVNDNKTLGSLGGSLMKCDKKATRKITDKMLNALPNINVILCLLFITI